MTEKEYRQHPAISRSDLWHIHESPEKFKWYMDHPQEPTPSLLFGQVVHKMVLQPDTFGDEFAVAPPVDRRTKAGKEDYALFCETTGDRTVITQDMYDTALDMSAAVYSNPLAARFLKGEKEIPFFWTDEDTDEDCKCRVDCLTETDSGLVIVDYKTAGNAKTEIFINSIFKYGYHFQAAMYSTGVMTAKGLTERPDFVFIVQEKNPPYSVNVVTVPPEVMLAGYDTYRELLGTYHECTMTNYWYGYTGPFDEPNEAYLPSYMSLGLEENDNE